MFSKERWVGAHDISLSFDNNLNLYKCHCEAPGIFTALKKKQEKFKLFRKNFFEWRTTFLTKERIIKILDQECETIV